MCLRHFFIGENPPSFARNVYECFKRGLFLCIKCQQNSLSLSCPSSNQLIFEVILLLLGTRSELGFDGLKKPDFHGQPASEAEDPGSSLGLALKH